MKIAIDIDGVLADHLPIFNRHIRASGLEITIDEILQSDSPVFDDGIPPTGFYFAMDEIESAWASMILLKDNNHEIVYVTNRMIGTIGMVETWLWLNNRLFPEGDVFFNDTGNFNSSPKFKTRIVQDQSIDLIVDDYQKNLELINKECPEVKTVHFNGKWTETLHEISEATVNDTRK